MILEPVSPAPSFTEQILPCSLHIPHIPQCPPTAKQIQKDVQGVMKPFEFLLIMLKMSHCAAHSLLWSLIIRI